MKNLTRTEFEEMNKLKLKECGETVFGDKLYICPACKERVLENGMSCHIIASAKSELWKREFLNKIKTPHLDIVKKFGRIRFVKHLVVDFIK